MRKEKLNELHSYIEELKVKKLELLDANGRFLTSPRYSVQLNNGKVITRERIVKNGRDGNASIILPITNEGNTLLVVQPRAFTKNGIAVEFPAGYVDDNETYEDAARRELLEETGYISDELIFLAEFYQDPGCSGAFNKAFLAKDCRSIGEQHLDKDEFIRYFECTYDEMLEIANMGYITDVQSQLVVERCKQYFKK